LFSGAFTFSEEAFAILLLGKNWKTWVGQALDAHTSDENKKILEETEYVMQ